MIKHNLSKFKKVRFMFFNSKFGVSSFPYNSLNCSFNTNDKDKNVIKNRLLVKHKICLERLFFINQIHSNNVFF